MTLDTNDEILQDFIVEADEILEELNEQLVELETQPENSDLLNAIFRGFHTIKGGAGFLGLETMVTLCHNGEDVFNILRKGERTINSEMMDTFLHALDSLNHMFAELKQGIYPSSASPSLLEQLSFYLAEEPTSPSDSTSTEHVVTTQDDMSAASEQSIVDSQIKPDADNDEISEQEFEALLDELHGTAAPGEQHVEESLNQPDVADNDEISEQEFEALLDELHGTSAPGEKQIVDENTSDPVDSDDISEQEFDALLDRLHPSKSVKPQPVANEQTISTSVEDTKPVNNEPRNIVSKPSASPKTAETSVRVDTSRLDDIMNMVGELVLVRNRINTLEVALEDAEMAKAVNNLTVVTADLQSAVMKTRMQPIKKVFGRFPRVVRDLARSLNKEITLDLVGEDTDLDKNLVEALADPLVHLVRNAVDHGIEMPDLREQAGKSRTGHIILSAAQEGDHILLTIADDGAGMDPDVLRTKAVEKGMMDEDYASRLTEAECYALIFSPGFSMKQEISDISGRGVGMDVVKTSISKLNGVIDIDSELGKGTTLSIKVPLTLAIMPTLMVMLGDQIFAFPLVNVKEIFHLDLSKTNIVDGQKTITVRNKALPLFFLRNWLANTFNEAESTEYEHVVIVQIGTRRVGFVVDQLIGQEEVVIKPLGAMLQGTKGLAGATITGDGRIALIVDFPELLHAYAGKGY